MHKPGVQTSAILLTWNFSGYMIKMMVEHDLGLARQEQRLKDAGHSSHRKGGE